MTYIIRFNYCKSSPGCVKHSSNKWFTDVHDAIDYHYEHPSDNIYISFNKSKYRKITVDELFKL